MLRQSIDQLPGFLTIYNVRFLVTAAIATLVLSATGSVVGILAGFGIAIVRRLAGWPYVPLRVAAIFYAEVFRRIPFLVNLFIVFYAFQLGGANVSVFMVGLVSVCSIATAYISEIVRAGFDSVHQNQWDSAAVLNFTLWQTLRMVVIPQAWKIILPPAFSYFLSFIKDSALASQIGVVELTYAGSVLVNRNFTPLLAYGAILVLYFVLSYPLSVLGDKLEASLARP